MFANNLSEIELTKTCTINLYNSTAKKKMSQLLKLADLSIHFPKKDIQIANSCRKNIPTLHDQSSEKF